MPDSDTSKRSRYGPIWARLDQTPHSEQPALSREQIVRAAIALADAEGLKALSMRRVAARLGVGTMSLYWHVPSKDDLLDLVRDKIMGEVELPPEPAGNWRADLRLIAHQTRAAFLRHPWFGDILTGRPPLGPNTLHHVEFSLAAIDGLGLDLRSIVSVLATVDSYVYGFVRRELAEQETIRAMSSTEEDWQATLAPYVKSIFDSGDYPRLARFIFAEELRVSEEHFAFGLECILDGIAARLPGD
jgi:AcrR family transcriptional regulator